MGRDLIDLFPKGSILAHLKRKSLIRFRYSGIEEIVVMVRLSLYNHGPRCGAQAIRAELDRNGVRLLPSIGTIKRILSRNCLTHGRTAYYPEDDGAQCLSNGVVGSKAVYPSST